MQMACSRVFHLCGNPFPGRYGDRGHCGPGEEENVLVYEHRPSDRRDHPGCEGHSALLNDYCDTRQYWWPRPHSHASIIVGLVTGAGVFLKVPGDDLQRRLTGHRSHGGVVAGLLSLYLVAVESCRASSSCCARLRDCGRGCPARRVAGCHEAPCPASTWRAWRISTS